MVPSLPLLSHDSSVSVKENPDRKKKNLFAINVEVIVECNCKKKIAMTWIDYTKAFDMVPHLWIKECLKLIVWKSGE